MFRIAAFAIAAAAIGAPALAQDGARDKSDRALSLVINAQVAPRCEVAANGSSISISEDISDAQGFAHRNVGQLVAARLNALGVRASCTGTANGLTLTRTAMVLANSDGSASRDGFSRAIVYELSVTVPSGTDAPPVTATTLDGGSGVTIGPIANAALGFAALDGARSEAVASAAPADGARDAFQRSDARLAAGQYVGTLVLTLTPGS